MLLNLHVKNLALIDEADIEFGEGLNILTGETGAGKSVLIGSVLLALGGKANKEMIGRYGEFALVEALFSVDDNLAKIISDEYDISCDDNEILVTRKISETKSIMKINGETVTAQTAREITAHLIDIHGQHEHQSLIYPANHLLILDKYCKGDAEEIRKNVYELYHEYKSAKAELETYNLNEDERLRNISFLEYEVNEIKNANILPDEDIELEARYKKINNAQRIMGHVNDAKNCIDGSMGEGALALVSSAYKALESASGLDDISNLISQISDIEGLISDFNRDLAEYINDLEFDDEEFASVTERLDLINNLKAKHGGSLEAINSQLAKKEDELSRLTDYEINKVACQKKVDDVFKKLLEACEKLSAVRRKASEGLTESITKALLELNFLSVDFRISIRSLETPTDNGNDFVEFLISVNPGETPLPLSKVASGGELSRIMLAIKTVLADKDEIDTLIFDEIDTGISGITAGKVAVKLSQIGKSRQVICITHLPQIAAMADKHFEISKSANEDGTLTQIKELDEDGSIMEIARILGGSDITEAVITSAKELRNHRPV